MYNGGGASGLTPSLQLVQLDTEQVGPPLSDQFYPKMALCFQSLAPGPVQLYPHSRVALASVLLSHLLPLSRDLLAVPRDFVLVPRDLLLVPRDLLTPVPRDPTEAEEAKQVVIANRSPLPLVLFQLSPYAARGCAVLA